MEPGQLLGGNSSVNMAYAEHWPRCMSPGAPSGHFSHSMHVIQGVRICDGYETFLQKRIKTSTSKPYTFPGYEHFISTIQYSWHMETKPVVGRVQTILCCILYCIRKMHYYVQ